MFNKLFTLSLIFLQSFISYSTQEQCVSQKQNMCSYEESLDDFYIDSNIKISGRDIIVSNNGSWFELKDGLYYAKYTDGKVDNIVYVNQELKQHSISSIFFSSNGFNDVCSISFVVNGKIRYSVCNLADGTIDRILPYAINVDSLPSDEAETVYSSQLCATNNSRFYTIEDGTYDELTSSDYLCRRYPSVLNGYSIHSTQHVVNGRITENSIVNIVPRELFTHLGSTLYIGEEYGFYINTGPDYLSSGNYCNDVFVFDVNYYAFDEPSEQLGAYDNVTIRIIPLFQYRYSTRLASNDSDFYNLFSSSDGVITILHNNYSSPNYYLSDVDFYSEVYNGNGKNYYDEGYNPYNDTGSYVIDVSGDINSCEYKDLSESFSCSSTVDAILDSVFFFGELALPSWVTTIIDTFRYCHDLYEYLSNAGQLSEDNCSDFGTDHLSFLQNRDLQIHVYEKIIKNANIHSDGSKYFSPRAHNSSWQCQFEGRISYGSASLINGDPSVYFANVALSMYGMNSYPVLTVLEPESLNQASHEFNAKERQNSAVISGSTSFTRSITLLPDRGFNYYLYIPPVSGYYSISNSSGLPMEIYDECYILLSSGSAVYSYFSENSYYRIKIINNTSSQLSSTVSCALESVSYQMRIAFGGYNIIEFTPGHTRTYSISLCCTGGDLDPELYIFDESGVQIGYNDDYNGDVNSFISIGLTSGMTYRIKCQMASDDYSGDLYLTIR